MASGDEELVNDVLIDSTSGEHGTPATATRIGGHQIWPRPLSSFFGVAQTLRMAASIGCGRTRGNVVEAPRADPEEGHATVGNHTAAPHRI